MAFGRVAVAIAVVLACASAKVFLQEEFADGDAWQKRWTLSKWKGSDMGKFELGAGGFYGDKKVNTGLQTKEDYRWYGISRDLDEAFDTKDKTMVFQFTAKHDQDIDCGGAYWKLLPKINDKEKFGGDDEYFIMFGPDICGGTKRLQAIITYKGKNHLKKTDISIDKDRMTHLYRFVIKGDNTYEISVDGKSVASGKIEDDWEVLPPQKIKDPSKSKPKDWVDEELMDDPEDKKPENWVDEETIPDPKAKKPEDWDDEDDGEWEAPRVPNPEFKGAWKPRKIKNPKYKGPWEHPMIDNPDYKPDANLHAFKVESIGMEVWQVRAGTVFDNLYLGDDIKEADEFADRVFHNLSSAESAMKAKQDAEAAKKAAEAAKKDEKKTDAAKKDDDDDDDDDKEKKDGEEEEHDEL